MDLVRELIDLAPDLKCDLGLFCGDVVRGYARGDEFLDARANGREPDSRKPEILEERDEDIAFYSEFRESLQAAPFPIYGVPGNMDAPEGRYLRCALTETGARSPLEVVHRSPTRHHGIAICGLGGEITAEQREVSLVLQFPRWEALHQFRVLDLVDDPTVVVLHTPPVGDVVDIDNGGHKGSEVVNEILDAYGPTLAVAGHAHDAQGRETIARTTVVNPGALKNGNYAVVDLESMEADLRSL